eukprot:s3917_g3.t1
MIGCCSPVRWLLQKSAAWCKRPALVDEKEQPPACRCEICARATAFLASPQGVECLGAACADPEILGRLSLCSRTQLQTVQAADFLARRTVDVGIQLEAPPVRLEQLAFAVAAAPLCNTFENHLYFSYGGGSQLQGPALPFLARAAALARRFPRVVVHIDAHAGVRAPGRLVAKRTSQASLVNWCLFEKTLLYRDLQDYHRLVDGYQAMEEILILGYLGEKVFWVREYQKKKHKILVVKGQLRWRLQRDCYDRGGKIVAGVKRRHPHQYLLNLKGHLYWRR